MEANSLDGEPCAPLSSTNTQEMSLRQDRTMDALNHSPSGMTCEHSTENRGKELLTWFLEGFPVRTSVAPVEVMGLKGKEADYGKKWQGSWVRFDPASSSWKTHQCSLFGGWESYLESWPRWGIMRHGECYQPRMPELPTSEKECGLLPTPTHKALISWWASAEYKVKEPLNLQGMTGGVRKSGAKIGSNLSWSLAEWHLRNGGARTSELIPDPFFYELMMGWPMGWTASADAATDKFHRWLNLHGKS